MFYHICSIYASVPTNLYNENVWCFCPLFLCFVCTYRIYSHEINLKQQPHERNNRKKGTAQTLIHARQHNPNTSTISMRYGMARSVYMWALCYILCCMCAWFTFNSKNKRQNRVYTRKKQKNGIAALKQSVIRNSGASVVVIAAKSHFPFDVVLVFCALYTFNIIFIVDSMRSLYIPAT